MSAKKFGPRLFILVCGLSFASAATEVVVPESGQMRTSLGKLDWAIVVAYMLWMLGIGIYYSLRTKTSEDYYLGGRAMKPSMVGLSLFATLISTISYLAVPGEVMSHGPVVTLMYIASLPIIYVVVCYLLIPYIMKLPITSAYEILENQLGRPVRIFGSVMFLLVRLVWMGLVIYTAANAVVAALGMGPAQAKYVMIVLGFVTVVYSSIGGLRAVVLTDALQAIILLIGALVCVIIVSVKMGGLSWFPTEWSPNWDTQPLFSLDPTVRVTVFGSIVATTVWWVCTAGSDQMAIQRYLSTRDAKAARKAFLFNNLADVVVTTILVLLGFALLGFFRAHPEYTTEQINLKKDTEYLFPHFVVGFMRFGMAGLVVSGMLAAAMSSLASGVNSTTTVFNTDVLGLLLEGRLNDKAKVRLGMWVSLAVGVVAILLALSMGWVPGNLYEVTQRTNGLFVAPLFGLFFFAMFVPFATPFGATMGSLYGFVAAVFVAFWELTGAPGLSFQYILAASLLVDIAVGCLFSLIPYAGRSTAHKTLTCVVALAPLAVAASIFAYACVLEAGGQ